MIFPTELFWNEKIKDMSRLYFSGTVLLIFGINGYTLQIIDLLEKNNTPVEVIFDNYKHGISIHGIPVIAPCESSIYPNATVIIASRYHQEMTEQLESLGYDREQFFYFFYNGFFGFGKDLLDPYYLEKYVDIASRGERIVEEIRNVFPDTEILLSPLSCIGDMYIMCLNLDLYLEQNRITNYTIAAPGNAACDLARRFGHTNVYRINGDDLEYLLEYYILVGETGSHLHILNLSLIWTSPFTNLLDSARLTWTDHYNKVLYQLKTVKNKRPACQEFPPEEYTKLLADGFQEGNTVILSPYAASIEMLDLSFWEKLTIILKKKGFQIYTNVTPKETEISGTKRLEIELKYIDDILKKAGILIAMRSGFCDVTCKAECRKIILYRDIPYFSSTPINVFSLIQMGLDTDVFEYVPSGNAECDINKICEYIGDHL